VAGANHVLVIVVGKSFARGQPLRVTKADRGVEMRLIIDGDAAAGGILRFRVWPLKTPNAPKSLEFLDSPMQYRQHA